jgi:hypothetical protein
MTRKVSTSALRNSATSNLIIIIALSIAMLSCTDRDNPFSVGVVETQVDDFSKQELINNVDNLVAIADYAFRKQKLFSAPLLFNEETVYVRGKADGSIETERHSIVKGAPLISVSLTHGNADFSTSTITRTYDSEEDFSSGHISSERIATIIGLASGQIKTTTVRDDTMISTSFKTPVVTITRDRTTIRQGSLDGAIEVIRTRTNDGRLISHTLISRRDDGAIMTKRIYPDLSWDIAAVKGKADGSIETTITTSEPTAVTVNDPTDITDSSVMLSWIENNDLNFARYDVYQSQFSGVSSNDTLAGTVEEQAATSFTVSGLSAETIYHFRVYVVNDVNQAKGSNEVSATTN